MGENQVCLLSKDLGGANFFHSHFGSRVLSLYKGLDPPIPTPGGRLKRKALRSRVEVFANAERK